MVSQVNQTLHILFYLKRKKTSKDGKIPIYVRLTIDGLTDEISTACKVFADFWNKDAKRVSSSAPDYKSINKKLAKFEVDLNRHFELIQVKNGVATPKDVFSSYKSPIKAEKDRIEKVENRAFSISLDNLIDRYIKYEKLVVKANRYSMVPDVGTSIFLAEEYSAIEEAVESLARSARLIYDNKDHSKTMILALDEYLLEYLQNCLIKHRSWTTLEKHIGRKRRYIDYMRYRFQKEDMKLDELEYTFISDLHQHLMTAYKTNSNSATKYCQVLKEIMDRVAAKKWIPFNIFSTFSCSYNETEGKWLSYEETFALVHKRFEIEKENEVKDVYIFGSFCGLSYAELYSLRKEDLQEGFDGKTWVSKDRQKTGVNESLPLLPICLQIIEKYKNHPQCIRTGRLLPVPTNQEYNRMLKVIGQKMDFKLDLTTHKVRYFMANEVTHKKGVELKIVGKILGQKSIKSTEIYVRPDKEIISESMEMIEEKLFNEDGSLKKPVKRQRIKKIPDSKATAQYYSGNMLVRYSIKN